MLVIFLLKTIFVNFVNFVKQEQAEGDDEVDDEAELNLEKVEEEMAADYSDEVKHHFLT
jgi:hypothetical protein